LIGTFTALLLQHVDFYLVGAFGTWLTRGVNKFRLSGVQHRAAEAARMRSTASLSPEADEFLQGDGATKRSNYDVAGK
jgi:hypothetical protein